jgi:TRAP-type C4-dicarboxylate transport system substrate-binding protein
MKKQRRILFLLLTFAVLSSLVIFGCAAPPVAPTPAAPPPAEVKPMEMSFAIWQPPVHSFVTAGAQPWAAEVEKQTGGRLKINLFPGAALGTAPDHYDLAVSGAADIADFNPGFTPGRFPLVSVIELPFLTHRSTPSSYAAWALYQEFPEIQAEFSQVKMFFLIQTDPAQLFTVKKPVHNLAELKGMSIRVPDERTGEAVKLLGATPVFMPMTEIYQALERATIDGCFVAIEACQSFRVHEVTKYCTMVDLSSITFGAGWNLDSWNRLPKDIQTLLEGDLGAEWWLANYPPAFEAMTQKGLQLMKDANIETINLAPDEMARWVERAMPAREHWAQDMEAEGKPGRKILDEAVRLEEKYLKEFE